LFEEYEVAFDTGDQDFMSLCITYDRSILKVYPDTFLEAKGIRKIIAKELW